MNEQQWLRASHPQEMGAFLVGRGGRTSKRKTRLFACACCYRISHLVAQADCLTAVEVAERFADASATWSELEEQHAAAQGKLRAWTSAAAAVADNPETRSRLEISKIVASAVVSLTARDAAKAALETPDLIAQAIREESRRQGCDADAVWEDERRSQAQLLRHIVGNPFRGPGLRHRLPTLHSLTIGLYKGELRSVNPLCVALRTVGLDTLANHFEEPDHPRGCWALDHLLGKK